MLFFNRSFRALRSSTIRLSLGFVNVAAESRIKFDFVY